MCVPLPDFDVGQVEEGAKSGAFSVRAVRSAE